MPDSSRKLTTMSTLDIYRCKCGCVAPRIVLDRLWLTDDTLREAKELVEDHLGCFVEVYVSSGFRCPKYNRKVDGARKSTHMLGWAIDFTMVREGGKQIPPKTIFKILDEAQRNGRLPKGGLHAYKTFTHIDIRGRLARW